MPTRTIYPDADVAGTWQINSPLGVSTGYTEPTVLFETYGGYYDQDGAADAFVNADDAGMTINASAVAGQLAVLVTFSADSVGGTELTGSDAPSIRGSGTNEVQTLSSDRTGGTFTLTFDGDTTTALDWDDTAADVEAALEALPSIGAGNVSCSGGDLPTDIVIEFTGDADLGSGGLAETDVSTITVTDSGTGGTAVSIAVTTAGVARNEFALSHSVNVPFAGDTDQPEIHVWTRTLVTADIGGELAFTVADHDNLQSWAASLLIIEGIDVADPFHLGGEDEGS